MQILERQLRKLIREEILQRFGQVNKTTLLSSGIQWHMQEGIAFDNPVYRKGSKKYFVLMQEARELYKNGSYKPQSDFEKDLLESDLGEWDLYEGINVPLDFPQMEEISLTEAKYKGRDVELGKPKRGAGGKAYVYVRNPKTGNVKKVSFGSSMPDAMGDSEAARKRRKSFGDRHQCAKKKDRTKPGYWSCRLTKFFGRDIPGWW
jgi:hypothetical protein